MNYIAELIIAVWYGSFLLGIIAMLAWMAAVLAGWSGVMA